MELYPDEIVIVQLNGLHDIVVRRSTADDKSVILETLSELIAEFIAVSVSLPDHFRIILLPDHGSFLKQAVITA
jgi:hypothetical protein